MATPKPQETVELNGKTFKIFPTLTVWNQAAIQKAIGGLLIGGAEGFANFPEDKLAATLQKLLSPCVWVDEDGKSRPLQESDNVDLCFSFDTATMYHLAFEVMRYYRFPFFEKLVAIGKEKLQTSGFANPTGDEPKTQTESAASES